MKLSQLSVLLVGSSSALASSRQQQPLGSFGASTAFSGASGAPSYRDALLAFHKSLVEIPSISGAEEDVGNFLVEYLTARDFQAQRQVIPPASNTSSTEATKPRFNVVAWPGKNKKPQPKVIVSSHIDTVPPFIPYSASDASPGADTVLSGRGSVDAKASVAAQVVALTELLGAGQVEGDDVMLVFVVGEEVDGIGMRSFSSMLEGLEPPPRFRAAIFGEPTEGRLACGHKGFIGCEVTAQGRAGHSGYPWLGKSATEVLMRALVRVLDTDLGSSERFGKTTVNVGRIEGGVALNVIPEKAKADLALRIAIGPQDEGAKIVRERLWNVLQSVDGEAFEMKCHNGYGAIDCACDVEGMYYPYPEQLTREITDHHDSGFENITVNYGTDVANLKGDHTRYLYGPGTILVAHGPDEALTVKELEAAVEGYKKLILHALEN